MREAARGEDFFRSAVIEALGDYKAQYAFDALTAIAKLDGPLQDDAALALGKIGDKRALETLAGLQRTAPRRHRSRRSPRRSACSASTASRTRTILVDTLKFADQNTGFQELLRSAAAGLAALGVAGRDEAARRRCSTSAFRRAIRRARRWRSALATVALRNTPLMLTMLEAHPRPRRRDRAHGRRLRHARGGSREGAVLRVVRRTYWDSPEDSPARELMQTLIGKLDF